MSPARPPEGARTAAHLGEGPPASPARPPEGARTAAHLGEGAPVIPLGRFTGPVLPCLALPRRSTVARRRLLPRAAWPVLLSAACLLVGACTDTHEELQQWMEEQRRMAKPRVPPLIPPRKFDPQPYLAGQSVDPFSSQKLVVALKQESRQPNSLLASEMNRRREPLEAYPLDAMTMVGSVQRGKQTYALVRADNFLYQVKVGEYVGQNYGRITKIGETGITLREIVQDAVGEWVERISTLELQERGAQEKSR